MVVQRPACAIQVHHTHAYLQRGGEGNDLHLLDFPL
jgi:hypothetical protein